MANPKTAGFITKGSRIHAAWMRAKTDPPASLAGMQMKFEVSPVSVTGVVRHVRSSDPANPSPDNTMLYVDPDPGTWTGPTVVLDGCTCGHPHVEVNPNHAAEVA